MTTDWKLIRNLMNSALDALEAADRHGPLENKRAATTDVKGVPVNVFSFMQSAWTYPENLKYTLIRARHELQQNKPYTPEVARALFKVAEVCAELVGCSNTTAKVVGVDPHDPKQAKSIEEMVLGLANWYREHFTPGLSDAVRNADKSEA